MIQKRHGPPVLTEARRAGKARFGDLIVPQNTKDHVRAQTGPRVTIGAGT